MKVLGIETSCDETAVAVLEAKSNRLKVLSNVVSSQVKLHAKYGGVVPNLAAREHVKNIGYVFKLALKEAAKNGKCPDFVEDPRWLCHREKMENGKLPIDAIAVTSGPGLGPALLVGIAFAKTIAWLNNKPLVAVNHLEGHIYSNWLKHIGDISDLKAISYKLFPVLNLIVSGGHTELILMEDYGKYRIVGETMDDAVGEAFDKVARLLDLGYPGGPAISKIAEKGNPGKYPLPRPMLQINNFDFSYSGLKTAVLYLTRDLKADGYKLTPKIKADIAASFQEAATDVLVKKTIKAAKKLNVKSIMLSGGVSANKLLRLKLESEAKKNKIKYFQPLMEFTTDNAAMIAAAGYFNFRNKDRKDFNWRKVGMNANLGF